MFDERGPVIVVTWDGDDVARRWAAARAERLGLAWHVVQVPAKESDAALRRRVLEEVVPAAPSLMVTPTPPSHVLGTLLAATGDGDGGPVPVVSVPPLWSPVLIQRAGAGDGRRHERYEVEWSASGTDGLSALPAAQGGERIDLVALEEPPPLLAVGFDGSPSSVAALQWATREAASGGEDVQAVYVWFEDSLSAVSGCVPVDPLSCLLPGQAAQDQLDAALADSGAPLGRVAGVPRRGLPTRELLRHSSGAELLVIGAGRRTPEGLLVVGAVTRSCVARSIVPVAVIPPPQLAVAPRQAAVAV